MKPKLSEITKATAGKTKTSGISPFSELEITKVYPNPDQPRKSFIDIEELADTIKERGLLQPITVVKKDDGYMIISGERRYKAHLHNEAKTIKAYILDATDEEVQELTLIENIQRNDLTDFEIANHIVKLWKTGRYAKKSDLAKKVGKSESYVSKAFSSLNLDDEILEDIAVNKKDISISVMDEISRVKDKKVQKEVYQKYNAGEITRDNIKEFKEPKKYQIKELVSDMESIVKDNEALTKKVENFTENFPTGNLEATFKVGDLVQDKQLIDTVNETTNATFEKIIDYGEVDDFEYSLKFNNIEANFYFTRPLKGSTPTFDINKRYKITIEEVENNAKRSN
ncbi:ParB/RepB/Spo0J family partition protein [Aliarcobacter butzleri]|uniref:ParB/RepB/Spo0J family partition protein n=1 Tax=Aliarcobacter butzleri TaxID=28197 RepID=UPI0021B4986A|nr:ParB/RepB/Spo0J family partition protein [Aliarcobacter butzleri]MCT7596402.1 ParB/RepB/Spo0J family partition protein [Aliarcobacter butzleri]